MFMEELTDFKTTVAEINSSLTGDFKHSKFVVTNVFTFGFTSGRFSFRDINKVIGQISEMLASQ